jgi:hypothetical protein
MGEGQVPTTGRSARNRNYFLGHGTKHWRIFRDAAGHNLPQTNYSDTDNKKIRCGFFYTGIVTVVSDNISSATVHVGKSASFRDIVNN